MRFAESMIRRIIKEEATRVLCEGSFPEEIEAVYGSPPPEMDDDDIPELDAQGIVERYMIDIEYLMKNTSRDREDTMIEVEGMIEDMCESLKDYVYDWAQETYEGKQMDRAEHSRDVEEDR